jgi:hypothetical protein
LQGLSRAKAAQLKTLAGMEDATNPILELLEHFDKLQLEVLAVHVEIHQRLFKILSSRLGCGRDDLPNLKFMHAARLAYAGQNHGNVIELLQELDSARNALAHENNPTKFTAKFAALSRDVLGPNYDENPPTLDAKRKQDYTALHFVKVLVETTHAG